MLIFALFIFYKNLCVIIMLGEFMKKNNSSNKNKVNKLFYKILSFILVIATVFLISSIIYLNMLPINYLAGIIVGFGLICLFLVYKLNHRGLVITKMFMVFLSILMIVVEVFISIYLIFSLDFINNIFDNNKYSEVYGIYIVKDKYKKVDALNNLSIGIYNNDEYINEALDSLSNRIKYKTNKYDTISDAIADVYDDKISALVINESLIDLYKEENSFELYRLSEIKLNIKHDDAYKEVNVKKEAFTVYLSGIDTNGKVLSSARSDVNILAVVNPKKGKILLVATPRDYYVTLANKNAKDKLTHAGIYGIDESALTLGMLYDVDINYYARINFTSFVKLIDTLDGINVDVEKPDFRYNLDIDCGSGYVCEQDSNREFGSNLIKFKYGNQTLSGEEALAYSRNRHQYASGDVARQKHQQQVLEGIADKLMSKTILTKYNSILRSLSNGIKTNIDKDSISKLVNKQLKENISWNIESIVATGNDAYDYCYSTGKSKVYVINPDMDSVNEIKDKIKEVISNE